MPIGGVALNWDVWLMLFFILMLFTNLYLSAAVYVDAQNRIKLPLKIPPSVWGLISFSFPLFGFFIYWLMTSSALVKEENRQ